MSLLDPQCELGLDRNDYVCAWNHGIRFRLLHLFRSFPEDSSRVESIDDCRWTLAVKSIDEHRLGAGLGEDGDALHRSFCQKNEAYCSLQYSCYLRGPEMVLKWSLF